MFSLFLCFWQSANAFEFISINIYLKGLITTKRMNKVLNSNNIRQQPFVIPDKVTLKDPALPFLSPICSFFDCDVQSSPGYLPLFLSSYSISLSILFLLSWRSNKGRDLLFIPSPTWGIAYPWRGIPQRHLGTLTASCRSSSVGTGQNYKRRSPETKFRSATACSLCWIQRLLLSFNCCCLC